MTSPLQLRYEAERRGLTPLQWLYESERGRPEPESAPSPPEPAGPKPDRPPWADEFARALGVQLDRPLEAAPKLFVRAGAKAAEGVLEPLSKLGEIASRGLEHTPVAALGLPLRRGAELAGSLAEGIERRWPSAPVTGFNAPSAAAVLDELVKATPAFAAAEGLVGEAAGALPWLSRLMRAGLGQAGERLPGAGALGRRLLSRTLVRGPLVGATYSAVTGEAAEPSGISVGETELPRIVPDVATFAVAEPAFELLGTGFTKLRAALRRARAARPPAPAPEPASASTRPPEAAPKAPEAPEVEDPFGELSPELSETVRLQQEATRLLTFGPTGRTPEQLMAGAELLSRAAEQGRGRVSPARVEELEQEARRWRELAAPPSPEVKPGQFDQEVVRDPTTGQEATVAELRERQKAMPSTEPLIDLPERKALHKAWIRTLNQNRGWAPETLADPEGSWKAAIVKARAVRPADRPKTAHIVLGPPAAGKSTVFADRILRENPWAFTVDADEVKKMIPEFAGGLNAPGVHAESSVIANDMLMELAVDRGDDIIHGFVGTSVEGAKRKLDRLAAAGYRIRLYLNELPLDKAAARMLERTRRTGRFIDPDYLSQVGNRPREVFEALKRHPAVDYYEWRSNDVPRGSEPRLIERGGAAASGGGPVRGDRDQALSGGVRSPGEVVPVEAGPGGAAPGRPRVRVPSAPAGGVEPTSPRPPTAGRPPFSFTPDLGQPKPRYGAGRRGSYELAFESDLDRVAYVLQNQPKSRAHDKLLAAARAQTGLSEADLVAHGREVRETVRRIERELAREGKKPLTLEIPEVPFRTRGQARPTPRPGPPVQRPASPVERAQTEAELANQAARDALEARAKALEGRPTLITAETGSEPARYAVLSARDIVASHIPSEVGEFRVNPLHPGNERGYGPKSEQRIGTIEGAIKWMPERTINTDPTPAGGPPMVAPWTQELARAKGIPWDEVKGRFYAVGGNSRFMMQQLLRERGEGARVDRETLDRLGLFGIDRDAAAKIEQPTLVRIIDRPLRDLAEVGRLVNLTNELPTRALSPEEAATSLGARLSSNTIRWLGETLDPERSLLANLADPRIARELRVRLLEDGVVSRTTLDRYFTGQGTLTDEGKLLVKGMILGRAVPNRELLATAPASTIDRIERIAPSIIRAAEVGPAWDLRDDLQKILEIQAAAGRPLKLADYLTQASFLEADQLSERAINLWQQLEELGGAELRARFARYAELAEKSLPTADPLQAGLDLGDVRLPPPSPEEAFQSAFVPMARGEPAERALSATAGFIDPRLAWGIVRSTVGGMSGLVAVSDDRLTARERVALTAVAIVLAGPALNQALARTGLHPGEAIWRGIKAGGAAVKDTAWRMLARTFGEAEAYRVLQYISYEYGIPEWMSRANIARQVGEENAARRLMDWIRTNLVEKLSRAERDQVTGIVRQVEQARQAATQEIERLQGLLYTLRRQGPGSLQQSNLFRQGDPTDEAGLLGLLQQALGERDRVTADAWANLAANPLTRVARDLVRREDQLADQLIAVGYDPAIFERFREAHLTRAYEKHMSPDLLTTAELRDPTSGGVVRDPAYWAVARQDLPASVRQELGEITDAAVLFAKGQTDKLHSLFTRRYFTELTQGYARDGLPMISGTQRPEYVQLPNSPALGPLAGQWAHPSVAYSLIATYNPSREASRVWTALRSGWGRLLGLWKGGKTAWSPWTQSRNFLSNAMLLHLSGMDLFDPRNNATFFRALGEYRRRGKLWEEASQAGVFRGSFWKAEVEDLFRQWTGAGQGTPIQRLAVLSGAAPRARRILAKPGDWYQASEHLFKFAKYLYNRERLGLGATEAAEDAVRTIFDYSAVPPIVRWYRQSPLGAPFVTFTYKAIPRLVEATLRHPDKVASLIAVFAAIESLGDREPLGEVSPELLPPWLRPVVQTGSKVLSLPGIPITGRQVLQLPFRGERGQAMANLQYLLPYGGAVPDTPEPGAPLWGVVPPAVRPGNPFTLLPLELLRNRSFFTDKPIRPDAASRDPALRNALRYYLPYVARQVLPNVAQVPGLVAETVQGDIPPTGLVGQLSGLKPVYVDPRVSAIIERGKLDQAVQAVQTERKRELGLAKQTGAGIAPEERREISTRARERLRAIRADREQLVRALRRAREAGY